MEQHGCGHVLPMPVLSPSTRRANAAKSLVWPLQRTVKAARTCGRNLTLQDAAVLGLCSWLSFKIALVTNPTRSHAAMLPLGLLVCAAGVIIGSVRGELLPPGPVRASFYRCGMFAVVGASYFVLRPVLAALPLRPLDRELLALDARLWGQTPALYLDRYVSVATVEWFAFFYYGYYALLAVYVLGALLLDTHRRRYELLLTVTLVITLSHALYTVVPGIGPFACPGLHFEHALQGGRWWARVQAAVQTAGAKYDIFPSLHTAIPVVASLHALRHRHSPPFSWICVPTCLMAVNIVVATLFLRWHYGVDVVAGGLLAVVAHRVAVRVWKREGLAAESGRQAVWEPVLPEAMPVVDRLCVLGILALQLSAIVWLLKVH
jgi:hypothetical protein